MNDNNSGFLEKLSWKAILAAIITFLTVFFAFPEYILNVRPQIEKIISGSVLSFIEGAISGSITTIIVLKVLADRRKKQQAEKKETQTGKKQS